MAQRLGAYGLALSGLDGVDHSLVPQPGAAPRLHVIRVMGPLPDRPSVVDGRRADLGLIEGVWFATEAGSETVTFTSPRFLEDAELVHPLLAPVAALHWLWRGREALHAGAVVLGGAAILILGNREAGKSTTLAHLAAAGHTVLADDMAVISAALTMPAGPRSIDRRTSDGVPAAPVRGGQRDRLQLGPAPPAPELAIRAWISFTWGDDLALVPLKVADKLATLATARRVRQLPGNPQTVLDLAALPGYELRRPRREDQIAPAIELLSRTFS